MVYWYGKQYDFAQLEHTYHLHSFLGKPFIIFYRGKKNASISIGRGQCLTPWEIVPHPKNQTDHYNNACLSFLETDHKRNYATIFTSTKI